MCWPEINLNTSLVLGDLIGMVLLAYLRVKCLIWWPPISGKVCHVLLADWQSKSVASMWKHFRSLKYYQVIFIINNVLGSEIPQVWDIMLSKWISLIQLYIYIYIYIYICVCVCVCVCARAHARVCVTEYDISLLYVCRLVWTCNIGEQLIIFVSKPSNITVSLSV